MLICDHTNSFDKARYMSNKLVYFVNGYFLLSLVILCGPLHRRRDIYGFSRLRLFPVAPDKIKSCNFHYKSTSNAFAEET